MSKLNIVKADAICQIFKVVLKAEMHHDLKDSHVVDGVASVEFGAAWVEDEFPASLSVVCAKSISSLGDLSDSDLVVDEMMVTTQYSTNIPAAIMTIGFMLSSAKQKDMMDSVGQRCRKRTRFCVVKLWLFC